MRSKYLPLAALALAVGCADAPMAPLPEPGPASLALEGRAPPPWALIEGQLTTDGSGEDIIVAGATLSLSFDGSALMSHTAGGNTATYRAWLLVTPGNQAKLLRFTEGGSNVTFSNGAMISNVNGKVSGRGTMTVGGHSYDLGAVTDFDANGECATAPWDYDGPVCATFSADDGSFSSTGSVWTGELSNDGGRDFIFPPGWGGCGRIFDCGCIDCFIIDSYNTKGKVR